MKKYVTHGQESNVLACILSAAKGGRLTITEAGELLFNPNTENEFVPDSFALEMDLNGDVGDGLAETVTLRLISTDDIDDEAAAAQGVGQPNGEEEDSLLAQLRAAGLPI